MKKVFILFISTLMYTFLCAQNITATKAYVDKKNDAKRDKSDLTVYSSDAKTGWGIKSFDVEQSFDFTGSNSWGWQSWKAEIFSYDGQKAKWQDSEYEMNWIESTNGVDFVASCIFPHEFSITSLTGSTHNAKWWIKVYYADSLATMSAITNAARDVVNTVYDEHLGISWTAKMYDGNLYYVAVTNANLNLEVTR